MQLDNDLLDRWLECRTISDQKVKQMVEEIQSLRDKVNDHEKELEIFKDKIYYEHGLVIA